MGSSQWRGVASRLTGVDEVVAPDLTGYGDSFDLFVDGETTLPDADEAIVRDACEPGGVHLVGHSYGGYLAIRVAAQIPDKIGRLTVIEPILLNTLRARSPDALMGQIMDSLQDAFARDDFESAMRVFVDFWNYKGAWEALGPKRQAPLIAIAPKVRAEVTQAEKLSAADALHAVHSMPCGIIEGSMSPGPAHEMCDLLREFWPDAPTIRIEAGHMSPVTHAARVAEAIQQLASA